LRTSSPTTVATSFSNTTLPANSPSNEWWIGLLVGVCIVFGMFSAIYLYKS
jgi:hypothetical protein